MIDYCGAPTSDEVEVVVFGPGYGEAIAVHLGEGHWLLADSCIDPNTKRPASLSYLECIGVDPINVKVVVATHWHDDHVRGISAIARACKEAEFNFSGAFTKKEAVTLLAAYSGSVAPALSRGTSELFAVMTERAEMFHLHHRSIVYEFTGPGGRRVNVTALSPSQAAVTQSVAYMAQYLPSSGKTYGNVVAMKPNLEAVVLHIDFGDDAILLGADLEEHAEFGWAAIAGDAWSGARRPSSAYKVAHHGSHTGDSELVWTRLLLPETVAAITPFNHGAQRLPTDADRARIKGRAQRAFISSRAGRRPRMDSVTLKRLGDVVDNLAPVNNGFGAIRMRKARSATEWSVTCFGDAHAL